MINFDEFKQIETHWIGLSVNGINAAYSASLVDIVNKCNNTYSTIKITIKKPVGVKSRTYIDFHKKNNKEDPKFKVGDHLIISKCKNIFAKVYVPDWKKLKKLLECVMKKNYKKQIINSLELKK